MRNGNIVGGIALALLLALAGCGGGEGGATPGAGDLRKADTAAPFTGTGTWWNPSEPGTGFFFEAQGGVGVVTFFVFDAAGRPTWVSAAGAFTSAGGGYRFEGTLQRFSGGQAAASTFPALPVAQAQGAVAISFTGNSAQVTLPRRSFAAQKFSTAAAPPAGVRPETGIYWNPDQNGRGYTVETIGDLVAVTMFHYDERGEPTWHLTTANLRHGGFTGPFNLFTGGQTLEGPYVPAGTPRVQGVLGGAFAFACRGELWLPGMATLPVRRFAFGTLAAGAECRGNTRGATDGPAIASRQTVLARMPGTGPQPVAVAIDGAGNAYVADESLHVIRKVAADGTVTVHAGQAGDPGYVNARGAAARFSRPAGIAVDAAGVVYVSDRDNNAIRKIAPDGTVTTLAGMPGVPETVNGTLATARFARPGRIRVDAAGNLFIAESGAVRRIGADGSVSTYLGGNSTTRTLGNGAQAAFYLVESIALDSAGNLYVSEYDTSFNGWVRKFDAAGAMVRLPNTTDGTLPVVAPADLAADNNGNIYILVSGSSEAHALNYQGVLKFSAGTLTLYGGAVAPTYPVPSSFGLLMGSPAGIALDPSTAGQRLLVADRTGPLWQLLP